VGRGGQERTPRSPGTTLPANRWPRASSSAGRAARHSDAHDAPLHLSTSRSFPLRSMLPPTAPPQNILLASRSFLCFLRGVVRDLSAADAIRRPWGMGGLHRRGGRATYEEAQMIDAWPLLASKTRSGPAPVRSWGKAVDLRHPAGISFQSRRKMHEMKFDMCSGRAAVPRRRWMRIACCWNAVVKVTAVSCPPPRNMPSGALG